MTRPDTNVGRAETSLWWKAGLAAIVVGLFFASREDGYYKGRSDAAKTCMKAVVNLCDEDEWQLGGCKTVNEEMKKIMTGEPL